MELSGADADRTSRASSTALDTVLFVLLVGAAVGMLAGIDAGRAADEDRVAEETADVVATSTTDVAYAQSISVARTGLLGGTESQTATVARSASGTYAELLAEAVTATSSVAGVSLAPSDDGLRREVSKATGSVLPTREANVRARATWRLYAGGEPDGETAVGDGPPADADVSAATMSVPSGYPNVTAAATRAADSGGFDGVATVVARGIVDGRFPSAETRAALYGDGSDFAVTVARYQHASAALGVDAAERLEDRDVRGVNEKLTEALASRIRDELAEAFDDPEAAANAIEIHRVRIVVGAWSP